MPHPLQLPDEPWFAYLMVFVFTALGTTARIFYNRMTGKGTGVDATLAQIALSVFASALVFMLAVRLGWLVFGLAVGCGLASWLGLEIITDLGQRLTEKLEGKSNKKDD